MADVRNDGVGQAGIVLDSSAYSIPPPAWTSGRNVRFRDNFVERMLGALDVFPSSPLIPYSLFPISTLINNFFVCCGDTQVFAVNGLGTFTDIGTTTYAGPLATPWTGGILNGILVISNSVDVPQYWVNYDAVPKLVNLPAWPSNVRAKVVRPIGAYIFMGDVSIDGVRYPELLRWSAKAATGQLPSSYDVTDPTNDANQLDCNDKYGSEIKDFAMLRDTLFCYKKRSVFGLRYTGNRASAWDRFPVLENIGIPNTTSLAVVNEGALHAFTTGTDLFSYDGTGQPRSVLQGKLKKFVEETANPDRVNKVFLVGLNYSNEVLFAFPSKGRDWCDVGILWNYRTDILTVIELQRLTCASPGQVSSGTVMTWDAAQATGKTWDQWEGVWNKSQYTSNALPVLTFGENRGFQLFDTGEKIGQDDFNAYVERLGLDLHDLTQDMRLSGQKLMVQQVYPEMKGAPVSISIGVQQEPNGAVSWQSPQLFRPGVDNKIDVFTSGRYMAIKIEDNANRYWNLSGYRISVKPVGRYV